MPDRSALRRLAAAVGIATDYHDIWGTRREVPETTLSALLRAMGLLDGRTTPQEALARRDAMAWRRPLSPAVVVFADEDATSLRLRLPRAACAGELGWRAVLEDGTRREGSIAIAPDPALGSGTADGVEHAACKVALPGRWPLGYHELTLLRQEEALARTRLIVAPRRCFALPAASGGNRLWGPAVQLYAVRSERNWGMGDFTDLRRLIEQWGERGAGIVGLNPLHALFPDQPESASPYSPSSRLHLNVLYLDVEAVPEFADCERAGALVRDPGFQLRLQGLRDAPLVDYAGVAAAKLRVLELLYRQFREGDRSRERRTGFEAFRAREGAVLERHALFEALQEHFRARDPKVWGWPAWPEPYRSPDGPAVAGFANAQRERIGFFAWLQWLAEGQLDAVERRSDQLGLDVGLYLDLAVSAARGGAETWAGQDLFAPDVSVGAPPDDFSPRGQDWGLPPWAPAALAEAAYEPFAALLRHAMRHAGALRIDHVMGLMRLYWVPANAEPGAGGYVAYPFADLLAVLALESHRNRCVVVGEDLGTVPDEVRAAMREFGILSYRPLLFEKLPSGEFRMPALYPAEALVAATTHDLPTLAGYWLGRDLTVRGELGAFPTERQREAQVAGRAQDRSRLLLALEREGLLPAGASVDPASLPEPTEAFLRSVQVFLARTPARLLMVPLEDALGVAEQVNLPGCDPARYACWRRKLPLSLEQCAREPRLLRLAGAIARERGRGPAAPSAPTLSTTTT